MPPIELCVSPNESAFFYFELSWSIMISFSFSIYKMSREIEQIVFDVSLFHEFN